jgi:hypothetical protein
MRSKVCKDAWMKWLLGLAGLIMLGIGTSLAVLAGGATAIMILVIAGGILALSPFLVDRLDSVSAGATSVEVRFTREVTDSGAPKTAGILGQTNLPELVQSYAFVHQELPYDRFRDARVYLQDLLVRRAAAIAQTHKLDAREIRTLFAEGPAVLRVLAIGLMTGDPSLADGTTIAAAISAPQSRNEQYHGLDLAQRCWPQLRRTDRQVIRAAVEDAVAQGGIPADSDRHTLVERVLSLSTT